MLKHGDLLDEARLPSPKSWSDILEDPAMPLLPNTPAGNDDNFSKTKAKE
jgi:hypothetical protein